MGLVHHLAFHSRTVDRAFAPPTGMLMVLVTCLMAALLSAVVIPAALVSLLVTAIVRPLKWSRHGTFLHQWWISTLWTCIPVALAWIVVIL